MRDEAPALSLQELPLLRGYAVEWSQPGSFILSRRNRLYSSIDLVPPFAPMGRFPAPLWKEIAARIRPAQRLLRFMYYNVVKLPGKEVFVTFDKFVGVQVEGRIQMLGGLVRPCRILRGACAVDADGSVFFGEYLMNPDRHDVHVYRYVPGQPRAEIVHTFSSRTVRHVHGIYFDPYEKCLWCVTGDGERECLMLRTDDGFRTTSELGKGDETWRCVSLLFTESSLYYATDAEFRQNVLYKVDRRTGARTVLHELDGPVYYSAAVGQDLFFAVTAELCPSQKSPTATLWHLDPAGRCTPFASFPKDRFPVAWFLPGTLHFPRGPGRSGEILFQGVGLRSADNRTFRIAV